MSDSQDLPGPRCGQYVSGGVASYPCWIETGHEGPCAAVEVPASAARRQQWLQARQAEVDVPAPVQAVPTGPVPGVPSPPVILSAAQLADPATRQAQMLAKLGTGRFVDMPEWAKQGVVSHSVLVSAGTLWAMAQAEFATGANHLVITHEFLEKLFIPVARDFFSIFLVQNPTPTKE